MCCCVRLERAVHAPGEAGCALRSLAHRLRRIGDELEKRRESAGHDKRDNNNNNGNDVDGHRSRARGTERRVSARGVHLLCTAVQVSALVLSAGWRHL